jgi:hypothetical protein
MNSLFIGGGQDILFRDGTSSRDLVLSGHNGVDHGLILGSALVTANAAFPGTAIVGVPDDELE